MGMESEKDRPPPGSKPRRIRVKPPALPTLESVMAEVLNPRREVLPGFRKNERFRPPASRWYLAVYAGCEPELREFCASNIDEAVARAMAIIPELDGPGSLDRLQETYPVEIEAFRLRIMPGSRARAEIEARFLARQNSAEIAARCGLSAEVVELYRAWFYEIGDFLEYPGRVENELIGYETITEEVPVEIVWKLMAYIGGPYALEELLRDGDGRINAEGADATAWLRADTEDQSTLRRWIFTRVQPYLNSSLKAMAHVTDYYVRRLADERTQTEHRQGIRIDFDLDLLIAGEGIVQCAPGAADEV